MKDKTLDHSRRKAMKMIMGGAASIPLAAIALNGSAAAAKLQKLDENDPIAAGLQYKHDASQAPRVDKVSSPVASQFCKNCQLAQGEGEWMGCSIFPGKAVKANGWCTAWVKRVG